MMDLLQDRNRWIGMMVAVALVGGLWIWLSAVPAAATTAGRAPAPRAGFAAPPIDLPTMAGEQLALSDLRGQVVVVNFWASWCPPCRAEMPALERTYQAERERGLEILAVNTTYQDQLGAARDFVAEHGLSFPVLLEESGEVAQRYQIRAMPTTFFVDREGVIREVIIGGPMAETTLRSTVDQLLKEGGG